MYRIRIKVTLPDSPAMARPRKKDRNTYSVESEENKALSNGSRSSSESDSGGDGSEQREGDKLPVSVEEGAIVAVVLADVEIVAEGNDEELTLSDEEKGRLLELELEVEDSFYRAGRALREIRDSRLYRVTHSSFEEYCKDRFGFERRYPYQLMDAAIVADNIRECVRDVRILPTNEFQLRPLTKLKSSPEKQALAWIRAVEKSQGKQPTYQAVKEIVKEFLPPGKETANSLPSLSVGQPVVVKRAGDPLLSDFTGAWGMVRELGEQGMSVEFYATTVGGINSADLEHFPGRNLNTSDVKALEKTLSQMKAIFAAYGDEEEIVKLIIRYFARLKRPALSGIERDILALLQRRANKVQEEAEVD